MFFLLLCTTIYIIDYCIFKIKAVPKPYILNADQHLVSVLYYMWETIPTLYRKKMQIKANINSCLYLLTKHN